ncbi:MAG: hypothetical protein WC749_03755 [Dehalococcoidia bacterium]
MARPVPAFARRAMMPLSFTPTEAKPLRTNYRDSFMGNRSNCGRLTRSTVAAWSARSILETKTSQTIFPNINNRQGYQEERL